MAENEIVALQSGAIFHQRYRVVRCIKAGGMGAVYEVVDDRTDSPRALKVMLPSMLSDPDLRARFALEAKVTGNVQSDHLVRVSDAGIDDVTRMPFLVMDLLQGRELGSMMDARGALPFAEVVTYLHQTALALDKTHAASIVHRDLKPENLYLTRRDDGSPCVKILDFGIAKVVAQSTARMTRAMGTPMFMAPEQIRGDASIGPRTDLFALGHIAYALLTGEPYWKEEVETSDTVFPLLAKITTGLPEAASSRALRRRSVVLPPAFDAWMARATAVATEQRFERATQMVAALAEALGVQAPSAGISSPDVGAGWSAPPPSMGSGAHASGPVGSGPVGPAPRGSGAFGTVPIGTGAASGPVLGAAPTAAPVVSTGVGPRPRSMMPPVLVVLLLGGLAVGVVVFMRSGGTPAPAASVAVATAEPTATAAPSTTAVAAAPTVVPSSAPAPEPTASATASVAARPSPAVKGAPRPASRAEKPAAPAPASTQITSPL